VVRVPDTKELEVLLWRIVLQMHDTVRDPCDGATRYALNTVAS